MNEQLINALKWITKILDEEKIPYHLVGGCSAHFYGSNRPINDIDINIPEDRFNDLYKKTKAYVTEKQHRYRDEKWDLENMTIFYGKQEIDIGGAYDTKILDEKNEKWVLVQDDFKKSNVFNEDGQEIRVIAPDDLVKYKKLLNGEHQKVDIKAAQKYILSKKL